MFQLLSRTVTHFIIVYDNYVARVSLVLRCDTQRRGGTKREGETYRDVPRGLDVPDVIERLNAEAVVRDAIRQLRVCN